MEVCSSPSTASEALLEAAVAGQAREVERLSGRTPLHGAASGGHLDIARLLLDHGADLNVKDRNLETCLHGAASGGHFDIARLLLDHGTDPSERCILGATAIEACRDDACRQLLSNPEPLQRWHRRRLLVQWWING